MSSNQYKTKDFKDLQAKWYKKLEKEGFEDIETADGDLKTSHVAHFEATWNPISAGAKEEYYRHAGFFLYEYKFATELERRIWELHAEGIGIREIVKILKKRGYKKVYKRKIHELLRPLVEKCLNVAKK